MAYTDDAVRAKLSALNETQESIVTVAQWVMFHRRHADRTATIWLQKLKEAGASKRLNLIYLANGMPTGVASSLSPTGNRANDMGSQKSLSNQKPERKTTSSSPSLPSLRKRPPSRTRAPPMKCSKSFVESSKYGDSVRSLTPPSKK